MRLVFFPTGQLQSLYTTTPADSGPEDMTVLDVELPDYLVAGISRAASAGRITYENGAACLDGQPYAPPPVRTPVSYTQAITAVGSASTVVQLREILLRVCDEFLQVGALEL